MNNRDLAKELIRIARLLNKVASDEEKNVYVLTNESGSEWIDAIETYKDACTVAQNEADIRKENVLVWVANKEDEEHSTTLVAVEASFSPIQSWIFEVIIGKKRSRLDFDQIKDILKYYTGLNVNNGSFKQYDDDKKGRIVAIQAGPDRRMEVATRWRLDHLSEALR